MLKSLARLFRKPVVKESHLAIETIKSLSSILVIDDHEVPFLVAMQSEGWRVTHWTDVRSLRDIEQGKYDLIFLDIQGVGVALGDDEGFGVLKRLKQTVPGLPVVAYSSKRYDATSVEFWKLADETMLKSAGAITAMDKAESLLRKCWSADRLISDLQNRLAILSVPQVISEKILKAVKSGEAVNFSENNLTAKFKIAADVAGVVYKVAKIYAAASGFPVS